MTPPLLSVVIPCFNEEENLIPVISELNNEIEKNIGGSFEILIINDGSTDNSLTVLESLKKNFGNVKFISHETNKGFGAALKTGFTASKGDYVTFFPADGEIPPQEVSKISAMTIGKGFVTTKRIRENVYKGPRTFMTYTWQFIMRTILGYDFRHMDGIFIVKGDILRRMNLHSDSGLICFEVLMRLHKLNLSTDHTDMACRPRLSGTSKIANFYNIFKSLYETFKLRLHMLFE